MAKKESEEGPGKPATLSPIAQLISTLTQRTSEAMDAARELESMRADDIIVGFAEWENLDWFQRLTFAVDNVTAMQDSLRRFVECAKQEHELWCQSRRFRPEVVEQTLAELHDRSTHDWSAAAAAWVVQIVEALARHEYAAATQLIEGYPDTDVRIASALKGVVGEIRNWAEGNAEAAVRISGRLREVLTERTSVATEAQAQFVLLAATIYQEAGQSDDAVRTMDEALAQLPARTALEAERAGLSLVLGQHDDATQRARLAVERAPGNPEGYYHLGTCSEREHDLVEAAELYEEGCARSTLLGLYRIGTGATFLRATGLLHFQRAQRLAELGHLQGALDAANDALREGIAGDALYPDAPVHELCARLLADIGHSEEAATAGFRAGQQHLKNGDVRHALPLLEKVWSTQATIPDAGWYYADALRAASWPRGAPHPDVNDVELAIQVWDDRVTRFGLPMADDAWAYSTRAQLSEYLARAAAGPLGDAAWEALVYVEKALVLNNIDARLWGMHTRFLRILSMDSAAMESADHGFKLDPDNRSVLIQRLGLLANAGRYADAEETLDRIPNRGTHPYLAGVRAWLLYHGARYEEAVKALAFPLAAGDDPGWYLGLRASCFVQLNEPAAARADLEHLLEVEKHQGPISNIRRAMALTELGRFDEAVIELEQINLDDRISTASLEAVWVAVHLAQGDLAAARSRGEQSLRQAKSVHDMDETLNNWRECLNLLAQQDIDVVAAAHVVDELAQWREMHPGPAMLPDANSEIERAREEHALDPPGSSPTIALAAMTGRRLQSDDRNLERAEAILRSLTGTRFEPEARMAVNSVLQQRLARAVSHGDEFQAQRIYEELADRGDAPPSPIEIVIASALAATGRYRKAINTLTAARVRLLDDGQTVLSVDERIGEYALSAGDTEMSLTEFGRALDDARAAGDRLSEAQVRARMTIAFAVRGDQDSAVEHLVHALRALELEGSATPSSTLSHELVAIAESTGAVSVIGFLSECLGRAAERVDPEDQGGQELLEALVTTHPRLS